MRLRYCDIVSFPVTLVLSVTTSCQDQISRSDQLLTVVTNIVRSGLDCCSDSLLGCVWHVIASASSPRTNGALAAAAGSPLDRPHNHSAACLSNPHPLVLSHNTDIPKTTAHNLSSSSQPWWPRYIVHKERSHQPQATTLHILNQDLAYQAAPDPNNSTAAVPSIISLLGHQDVTYHW